VFYRPGGRAGAFAGAGVSLEVAAREARHAFFRQAMLEGSYDRLALAHHRDDQAETVLLRLMRGAGTRGLGAMAPLEKNGIVRPLLCAGRDEIRAYCRANDLPWREDETNADASIPRNWVRMELLPLIRERLNPAASEALCRAAELLREDEDCLDALARQALAGMADRPGGGAAAPVTDIAGLHPAVQSRALRLLAGRAGLERDVERVHVGDVAALLADGMSGRRVDLGGGFAALREGGTLSVVPAVPEDPRSPPVPLQMPGTTYIAGGAFVCEALEGVPDGFDRHVNAVQYFDRDAFPRDAVARSRLPGDRFHALGAAGGRKLKEYLIDRGAPRWGRDAIPLLASGSEVLWVVGHGISDKVKITAATTRVWKITYIAGEDDERHA
jgi:tRNA(Ile)-lysidine synthase